MCVVGNGAEDSFLAFVCHGAGIVKGDILRVLGAYSDIHGIIDADISQADVFAFVYVNAFHASVSPCVYGNNSAAGRLNGHVSTKANYTVSHVCGILAEYVCKRRILGVIDDFTSLGIIQIVVLGCWSEFPVLSQNVEFAIVYTEWVLAGINLGIKIIVCGIKNGGLYGVFALGSSSALYANDTYYGYDVKNKKVDTNVSVDTAWHNVIHNFVDGTLKLDDTTVEFAPFSFTNNVNSHLFTRYYNGTYGYYFSGYVKKHKITRNGVVIINLIPARRDRDGEVGMYDLANPDPATAFYTNAGTGEFTAGPDM